MKASEKNQSKKLANLEDQKVRTENVKGGRKNRSNPLLDENIRAIDDKHGTVKFDVGGKIKSNPGNRVLRSTKNNAPEL